MTNPIATKNGQLPAKARQWLMEAAKINDPKQRKRALEEATRRVQLNYPQFFKEEAIHE